MEPEARRGEVGTFSSTEEILWLVKRTPREGMGQEGGRTVTVSTIFWEPRSSSITMDFEVLMRL